MNTISEIIEHGINYKTAEKMLDNYKSKIGTKSGVYEILDIEYNFDKKTKIIKLRCSLCGKIVYKSMASGKNKWSELAKTCSCQSEKRKYEQQQLKERKKQEKIKKETAELLNRLGEIHGDYKIISLSNIEANPKYTLRCIHCGAEKQISASTFESRKDFHCTKHYTQPIKFDKSYVGKKNNRLLVIDVVYTEKKQKKFKCKCDCGKIVLVEPTNWEKGYIKSCGCLKKSFELIHNESLDRLRRIYNGMIQRCYNKNSNAYKYYGGRGIMVCEEWKNNRDNFIEWALKNGYSNTLTIDRINNNGIYEPDNCRWATYITQANNQRKPVTKPKHKKITKEIDGKVKTLQEWYDFYDTSGAAVRYRMKAKNMTFEEALKTPKLTNGRPRKEA